MSLEWKDSLENVDWQALSDLYRVAPLGNKSAPHLQRVFSNSLYRCFVYDDVTQLLGHIWTPPHCQALMAERKRCSDIYPAS